jgi:glc operon protein GlcG
VRRRRFAVLSADMRHRPVLVDSDVRKIAAACRAEAEKNHWSVTIAVVDDGGCLWHLERLDGASPLTVEGATHKARTAAISRRSTKSWEDRVKERPVVMAFPGILPIQGGVPIVHEGECVGAVGVSGRQSEEDEQIANTGLAALDA